MSSAAALSKRQSVSKRGVTSGSRTKKSRGQRRRAKSAARAAFDPTAFELGCTLLEEGAVFRVWAPHAEAVSVVGDFNDWDADTDRLTVGEGGVWSGLAQSARDGQGYKYRITFDGQTFDRIDPRAREVTNSVGESVVRLRRVAPDDGFQIAPTNELVIYEMHLGTFFMKDGERGTFATAIEKLDHLRDLGINAVEVMPLAEFAGDISWGYNPAHPYAVEQIYGGPEGYVAFIAACHERGIAVIQDLVFNHFGPSDLDLWRFDGWGEGEGGGIYFYNDWRSATPWGSTRPDYGREEVRQYIVDNVRMWADEYGVDGVRLDMTLYIRHVSGDGDPGKVLGDGVDLVRRINALAESYDPPLVTIAEDLRSEPAVTRPLDAGGMGFTSQWSEGFVHPVRAMLKSPSDGDRSAGRLRQIVEATYEGNPFARVLYTESHDEAANGSTRVPAEIDAEDPYGEYPVRRSCLGAAITMFTPGVPMLLQGQELLASHWFTDVDPVRWGKLERFPGVVDYYRTVTRLRRNADGVSAGLAGPSVAIVHEDESAGLLVFHRWNWGGPGDDCVAVINLHATPRGFDMTFPRAGRWGVLFDGDSKNYGEQFGGHAAVDVSTDEHGSGHVEVGGYAAVLLGLQQEGAE